MSRSLYKVVVFVTCKVPETLEFPLLVIELIVKPPKLPEPDAVMLPPAVRFLVAVMSPLVESELLPTLKLVPTEKPCDTPPPAPEIIVHSSFFLSFSL